MANKKKQTADCYYPAVRFDDDGLLVRPRPNDPPMTRTQAAAESAKHNRFTIWRHSSSGWDLIVV